MSGEPQAFPYIRLPSAPCEASLVPQAAHLDRRLRLGGARRAASGSEQAGCCPASCGRFHGPPRGRARRLKHSLLMLLRHGQVVSHVPHCLACDSPPCSKNKAVQYSMCCFTCILLLMLHYARRSKTEHEGFMFVHQQNCLVML